MDTGGKFEGLTEEDFRFMRELQANNNKPWFDSRRDRWEGVRERMRSLCIALGQFVHELDPGLETEPKSGRCLGRINRDTRFSPDKRPYKHNFDILFFPREHRRTTAPGFAVGITPDHGYIGTWLGAGMKQWRDRFEANIAAHRETFNRYLMDNDNFSDMNIRSESYARPKVKGLPQPAFEWAQRKYFYMGSLVEPGTVAAEGPAYIDRIERTFIRLYPLFLFATSASLPADLESFREKFR